MANTLKLEIVTPEGRTFPAMDSNGKPESNDVDMVTLPGVEGEMGIYPLHVPLMTQVVAGEVIVRKGGRDFFLAIGDGFVEITGERVAVMTDMAIKAENIDEAKAEEARRRAEARLAEKLDDEQLGMVNAALAHSLAQLKVKRRTHS
ncbi:MAG: atpC [Pedosphaera sp.]|nr:atpC [Pedosphaera sp.]